jgi:hypothetical protein
VSVSSSGAKFCAYVAFQYGRVEKRWQAPSLRFAQRGETFMRVLTGHSGRIRALSWSAYGRVLGSLGSDGTVRVWDTTEGRQLARCRAHPEGSSLALSGNLVYLDERGRVRSWDWEGRGGAEWLVPTEGVRAFIVDAGDARTVAVGVIQRGRSQIWRGNPVTNLATEVLRLTGEVECLALAPDSVLLAAVTRTRHKTGHTVRLWDWRARKRRRTLPDEERVRAAAFSEDGRMLATACGTEVLLWDVTKGRRVGQLPAQANALACSPDGRTLATADSAGLVRFWELAQGRESAAFDWRIGVATAVAFSPDGMTCAAGGEDGRIIVWDAVG